MKQDVKTKVKGIVLAIFFALIAFICLVVLNNRISGAMDRVDVVIAAKTIPKNTLITEDNVGDYFTTIQAQSIFKTSNAVTNPHELIGQYALNGIWDKAPVNQDMFQSQLDIFAAYKKPVQASFHVNDLSDAVCGRLRAGDYIDIFGIDMNQGKRIIENAYIFKAYDNAGVQISVSDTTAIATNFTIILESGEEEVLYEMLKNSTVIVTKSS